MLERLHEHIVSELGQSSRTDTIFVIVAILFDLIALGINSATSGAAAQSRNFDGTRSAGPDVILAVFILMTVIVNTIAVAGLYTGQQTRAKLLKGLVEMYADNQVDKYYDRALLAGYATRYLLFGSVIVVLAVTSIIVPLVIRLI